VLPGNGQMKDKRTRSIYCHKQAKVKHLINNTWH
jgi:hypothetical protein